jgi:hypothetical protein
MKKRLTPAELDARLKFIIGCMLGFVLMITTIGVLWALVFVTQPIGAQAEKRQNVLRGSLVSSNIHHWDTRRIDDFNWDATLKTKTETGFQTT